MLINEMSVEENIIFLSKKMIKILPKIESIDENEKQNLKDELLVMIDNPKFTDVSRLKDLSFYLEERSSKN